MGHGRSLVALQKLRPALFIIVSFIRKRIRHFEFFVLDSNINNKRCLSFDLFDEIRPAYACESSCIVYRVHEPKNEKRKNETNATKDEKINLFRLCSFLIWSFAVADRMLRTLSNVSAFPASLVLHFLRNRFFSSCLLFRKYIFFVANAPAFSGM